MPCGRDLPGVSRSSIYGIRVLAVLPVTPLSLSRDVVLTGPRRGFAARLRECGAVIEVGSEFSSSVPLSLDVLAEGAQAPVEPLILVELLRREVIEVGFEFSSSVPLSLNVLAEGEPRRSSGGRRLGRRCCRTRW